MKANIIISILVGAALVLDLPSPYPASGQQPEEPVVMLIQAAGKVAYSTDGSRWKPIKRNKFLYEGWGVKTGRAATCKLLLLQPDSNKMEVLDPNTRVVIRAAGTQVVSGRITERESSSSLPGQLRRKLAQAQKYTTVSRKERSGRVELMVAEKIRLNSRFPDLAWENAGKEYSYRLSVGDEMYEAPGSDSPVIRFALPGLAPGKYDYEVQVLFQGEVFHTPDRGGVLTWMSPEQTAQLDEQIRKLKDVDEDNGCLLGNLLDDEGVKVGAMDQYTAYLKAHPDANEIRPFLVKVLYELGLSDMRQKEALLFQENSAKP